MRLELTLIFASALLLVAASAFASQCTTQTIITPDGRLIVCSVCCDSRGNCTTMCV